jgi:hypothetical protein
MKPLYSEAPVPLKFRSPRDAFAVGALQVLMARKFDWGMGGHPAKDFAEMAYEFADAMMRTRERDRDRRKQKRRA